MWYIPYPNITVLLKIACTFPVTSCDGDGKTLLPMRAYIPEQYKYYKTFCNCFSSVPREDKSLVSTQLSLTKRINKIRIRRNYYASLRFQTQTTREFGNNKQGHPTTVFCKISVRRSKYWLEFSIAWIQQTLLTERSIQLQIPYDFLKFYFSYLLLWLG